MSNRSHTRHDVHETSQIGEARRNAARLAERAGMTPEGCNDVAIVATELATNLVNHARDGALLMRAAGFGCAGVELIALDRGPGIGDLSRCLVDGYSTRGTPGNGFGSMRRLSAQFDVWTEPAGTAVLARLGTFPRIDALEIGSVCLALKGEQRCGDSWSVREGEGSLLNLLLVDGLGHGFDAANAADAAVAAFDVGTENEPREQLERIDRELRGTRGGAVAVAGLDRTGRKIRFCGVGNIAARIDSGTSTRGLVSSNGIVGGQYRRSETYSYDWPAGALLVAHSDGLQTRWDLGRYPGLRNRHPALIAAVLYRDFARGHDDVTVVVVSASFSARLQ